MSTSSKSPRKVAAVALETGRRMLPKYGHRYSRKDFTLPQLFACLVLRKFFKTDYRGICEILNDCTSLCTQIGLKKIPHFTTLQKKECRLLRDSNIKKILGETIAMYHDLNQSTASKNNACQVDLAAADSTGFETQRASRHFITRRSTEANLWQTTTYRRFAKLGIVIDCENHLIMATHCGLGPKPDVNQLQPLLKGFCANAVPTCLLADAGYDSESNHVLLREKLGIDSVIPPKHGRPTKKLPTGKWRFLMATDFQEEKYNQRWQVETVMYMLKQHQGASLTAHRYQTRRREMGLMAITHNIMIVLLYKGFYRAFLTPFLVFDEKALWGIKMLFLKITVY